MHRLIGKYLKRILKGALANVNTLIVVMSTILVSDKKKYALNCINVEVPCSEAEPQSVCASIISNPKLNLFTMGRRVVEQTSTLTNLYPAIKIAL